MNPTPQARILEAKQLFQQSPDAFAEWLVAFYREQDAKDWQEFLWGFFDLSSANDLASPSEPEAITLSALEQALAANQLSLAYQLYTPLVRTGILSQEKVLDLGINLLHANQHQADHNREHFDAWGA